MGRGEYYRNNKGFKQRVQAPLSSATWDQLANILQKIHSSNYGAYHDLERAFKFQSESLNFTLEFDHIQSDPYASPSRAHVTVSASSAAFSTEMHEDKIRNVALCDYLTRIFAVTAHNCGANVRKQSNSWHGTKGGDILIDTPGQHVIERSSVNVLVNGDVEVRFNTNLPARGRTICGDYAYTILVETLPKLIEQSLLLRNLDVNHLWKHLHSVEDQETLRGMLKDEGLVGFVRDGAILPRQSGASDLPLDSDKAIQFKSPKSLRKVFKLPNCGEVTGMGIPRGVTLFVGGGFHGKSTILKALEVGVYNHIPSDGREFVVVDPHAAKIRSEDSRSVVCTDISAFINNLPFKQDTTCFSTADASGSTSQAANIIEALEVGATTLLIDEDTCATNFMIRDWKMQQLVAKEKEPITPFISKVQALFKGLGVSSILVIGGAGDYFSVADHVIMMDAYEPRNVTNEAKTIASKYGEISQDVVFGDFKSRIPLSQGFEAKGKVVARGLDKIQYGEVDLDLSAVEQIVEPSQVRTIADALQKAQSYMDGKRTLMEVLTKLESDMDSSGSLDVISIFKKSGFYTRPRKLELAAAFNRLRTATITQ
ncbi:P-loop containing nucleoside triphosphate hydrolase [Plasmopara halstedii]|uniref:p-loop containing nucleoside triphosphate hydrolase n=1 Tax=Plasmopara halstedii TaxID=4781 RepID=A0A0P1AXD1_PLAHL|nr:P-loop containing nucleoside triphosphate hydrolase [Plasmopara halstedii]CEG45721.1 P-loop containing nucleoside triphosphate hydrolase [Plasmopara halstedii]|eukprot:XP_024582090.1 P-loop containing nucleoside triphosphate hydrolase [Plasmopara halstedii]